MWTLTAPQYSSTAWPGGAGAVASKVSTPIKFSSPLFTGPGSSGLRNYQQAAFETDLPRIEFATNPPCQRHVSNPADPSPGSGCVNPPLGPNGVGTFYPMFTTTTASNGSCIWQEGGANLPEHEQLRREFDNRVRRPPVVELSSGRLYYHAALQ